MLIRRRSLASAPITNSSSVVSLQKAVLIPRQCLECVVLICVATVLFVFTVSSWTQKSMMQRIVRQIIWRTDILKETESRIWNPKLWMPLGFFPSPQQYCMASDLSPLRTELIGSQLARYRAQQVTACNTPSRIFNRMISFMLGAILIGLVSVHFQQSSSILYKRMQCLFNHFNYRLNLLHSLFPE